MERWYARRQRAPARLLGKTPKRGTKAWEEWIEDAVVSLADAGAQPLRYRYAQSSLQISPVHGVGPNSWLPLGWCGRTGAFAASEVVFQEIKINQFDDGFVSNYADYIYMDAMCVRLSGRWQHPNTATERLILPSNPRLRLIVLEVDTGYEPLSIPSGIPSITSDDLFSRGQGGGYNLGGVPGPSQVTERLDNALFHSALKPSADQGPLFLGAEPYIATVFGTADTVAGNSDQNPAWSTQDIFVDRDPRSCSFNYRVVIDTVIPSTRIEMDRKYNQAGTDFNRPVNYWEVDETVSVKVEKAFYRRPTINLTTMDPSGSIYRTSRLVYALIPEMSPIAWKGYLDGSTAWDSIPGFVPSAISFEFIGVQKTLSAATEMPAPQMVLGKAHLPVAEPPERDARVMDQFGDFVSGAGAWVAQRYTGPGGFYNAAADYDRVRRAYQQFA